MMTGIAYDSESKTEVIDDGPDDTMHIYGFPADIIPAIFKYNRENPGPDGNAINITQTCIDALRLELKKREHPLRTLVPVPNVGPVELRKAADIIKAMGSRPDKPIGTTDEPIWLCPRCFTVISDIRYNRLNPEGCCDECETTLVQYSRVVWRQD